MTSTDTPHRHRAEQSLDDRPLILVVHRSPSVRHALLVTLDLDGFDVLPTGDSAAAVSLLADAHPRVVIADLAIGGTRDGALLHRLKSDAETAGIPVIHFGQRGAESAEWDFSVNGVRHVRREEGVSRLLEVLHEVADQTRPLLRDGPAA